MCYLICSKVSHLNLSKSKPWLRGSVYNDAKWRSEVQTGSQRIQLTVHQRLVPEEGPTSRDQVDQLRNLVHQADALDGRLHGHGFRQALAVDEVEDELGHLLRHAGEEAVVRIPILWRQDASEYDGVNLELKFIATVNESQIKYWQELWAFIDHQSQPSCQNSCGKRCEFPHNINNCRFKWFR